MAYIQNTTPYGIFLNTSNTNAGTYPGTSASTYYGISISKGIISLIDSNSDVLFSVQRSQVIEAVYTPAVSEVDGVVTYTEPTTLVAGNTYYFTLSQLIPQYQNGTGGVVPNQYITNVISYTIPTGGSTAAQAVATGLGNVLAAIEGYQVTTAVTTVGGKGVLTITAASGYPILLISGVDQYGTIATSTTGVQSVGHKADLANSIYGQNTATNTGYVSTNTYDRFYIQWQAQNRVTGAITTYSATIFINTGAGAYSQIKSCLQAATTQSLFDASAYTVSSNWLQGNVADLTAPQS